MAAKKIIVLLLVSLLFPIIAFTGTGRNKPFSEQVFKKFQLLLDNLCLELATAQNKIAASQGKGPSEQELRDMAQRASFELMTKYKDAFVLSDIEAKKIFYGDINDAKNKIDINDCISRMAKLNVQLPMPIQYLIERYNDNSLLSFELEFAARLFKEYLKQIEALASK